MDFIRHIKDSFSNLLSAKLRSFLAILGVLVGTGSVVALISSSQLATLHALAQFKTLGTNLLAMSVQQAPGAQSQAQKQQLRFKHMPLLNSASPQIVLSAPYISIFKSMRFKGKPLNGEILAATGNLSKIVKIEVAKGRFVSVLDRSEFYCDVGSNVAKKMLKMGVKPIGQQIQVGKKYFTVIGVVKPWQPNLFMFNDINDGIIIPLKTAYLLSKTAQISNVLFRLIKEPQLKKAQSDITARMREILPKLQVRFRNPEQIIKIVAKQRKTFTWLLGAIGGISLIVGGIGVMNIMLVSVVERRREIGIRMAIGAQRSDIMKMFLIESVILTVFGGIVGIIFGVLASYILSFVTGWEFKLFLLPPVLGFVVSALVGIVSGFYPSYRASRLDPIQTLQSD